MAIINLSRESSNQLVIHFGGELTSVDAYTLANSLVSIADSIREINRVINPTLVLEVRVEAIGPGSFRAVLRSIQQGSLGLLKRQGENTVINILIALIFMYWGAADQKINIVVNETSYVVEVGNDKIVLPKEVQGQLKNVQDNAAIQESIQKTFRILSSDPAVENFGFAEKIDSPEPFLKIPKEDFPRLSEQQTYAIVQSAERTRRERARLIVNRMWLRNLDRKWSFEWNGVPVSACVKDEKFRSKIQHRLVTILSGDALDVEISFSQRFDEKLGLYVNDQVSFVIERVIGKIDQSTGQEELF
jgi:hypothetical protein